MFANARPRCGVQTQFGHLYRSGVWFGHPGMDQYLSSYGSPDFNIAYIVLAILLAVAVSAFFFGIREQNLSYWRDIADNLSLSFETCTIVDMNSIFLATSSPRLVIPRFGEESAESLFSVLFRNTMQNCLRSGTDLYRL